MKRVLLFPQCCPECWATRRMLGRAGPAGCGGVRDRSKKPTHSAASRKSHVPPSRWSGKWSRSKYGSWKAMSESPGRAQPSELHRAAAAAAAITAIATSAPARRCGCHRTGVGLGGADAAEERDAAVSRGAVGYRGPAVEREPTARGRAREADDDFCSCTGCCGTGRR